VTTSSVYENHLHEALLSLLGVKARISVLGFIIVLLARNISHDEIVHEKYMFRSNLNCKFGFFFAEKCTIGAVLD